MPAVFGTAEAVPSFFRQIEQGLRCKTLTVGIDAREHFATIAQDKPRSR